MQCKDCMYMEEEKRRLRCHRYPPQLLYDRRNEWNEFVFPEVSAEDWCGECTEKE